MSPFWVWARFVPHYDHSLVVYRASTLCGCSGCAPLVCFARTGPDRFRDDFTEAWAGCVFPLQVSSYSSVGTPAEERGAVQVWFERRRRALQYYD